MDADSRKKSGVRNQWPGLLLGAVSTAVLAYFALRGVDVQEIWHHVKGADPRWTLAIAASSVLADLVRAARWGTLLGSVKKISLGTRFRSVMIGSAGNHILPLRLGEVLRVDSLARKSGLRFTTVLTTLVVERVFDVVGILLILAYCLATLPAARDLSPAILTAVRILAAGTTLLILAVMFALLWRQRVVGWLDRFLAWLAAGRLARIVPQAHALLDGMRSLGSARQILAAFAQTMLLWFCFGLSFAFGLKSLGLDGGSTVELLQATALILVFVSIFTMIPAAVGMLGTFQAGCIVALAVFGIPKDQALGFSIVVHSVQLVTSVIIGVPFLISSFGGIGDLFFIALRRSRRDEKSVPGSE